MENFFEFEINNQKFEVVYKKDKNLVWAITDVNGRQIKAHGDCTQTAYWAIKDRVNITLNFRL